MERGDEYGEDGVKQCGCGDEGESAGVRAGLEGRRCWIPVITVAGGSGAGFVRSGPLGSVRPF